MIPRSFSILLGAAIAAGLCISQANSQSAMGKAERDELFYVAKDDPVMAAAMRKARATLADFLALAAAPPAKTQGFGVKVAIRQGDNAEYFWIAPFERNGEQFSGPLDNTPRSVAGYKKGDKITFSEKQIVDWIYVDNGRMKATTPPVPCFPRRRSRTWKLSRNASGSSAICRLAADITSPALCAPCA